LRTSADDTRGAGVEVAGDIVEIWRIDSECADFAWYKIDMTSWRLEDVKSIRWSSTCSKHDALC
jgi:hypothetical protein